MKSNYNKPVSVVIPNYNGLALLQMNLPAVFSCLRNGDELILVDDASTDASVRWLQDAFNTRSHKLERRGKTFQVKIGKFIQAKKQIRVVVFRNRKNLRFAQTSNLGVELAQNELVFLLNSDVSPHRTVLRYLLDYFADDSVFAVGCLELSQDPNNPTHTKKQGKNTLAFKRGMFIHAAADNFEPGATAWATGGSAIFDRQKWLELEGFDPIYAPAYWEDIDLSFRARKKGWKVLFEPRAKVDHNHETTNIDVFGQQKITAMSWKNAQKFVGKNATWWQKLLHYLWKPYWWFKM